MFAEVMPKGALKTLMDRVGINKVLVAKDQWSTFEQLQDKPSFVKAVQALPKSGDLLASQIAQTLQTALEGTYLTARVFVGFKEAYFYVYDQQGGGDSARPMGRSGDGRVWRGNSGGD
jgi:hypothetical protein